MKLRASESVKCFEAVIHTLIVTEQSRSFVKCFEAVTPTQIVSKQSCSYVKRFEAQTFPFVP